MAQVKKPWVREAILAASLRLFQQRSYQDTTLTAIAREAGVSSANLYVYFGSKLEILYAVYEPWMRARLARLEEKVKRVDAPLDRIRLIVRTLWRDIPAEENGFVRNIVQALSMAEAKEKYSPALLEWMEERLTMMILSALPPSRRRIVCEARLARMLVMALDGYSIHYHLHPRSVADDATIDAMARLLLGAAPARQSKQQHGTVRSRSTLRNR